MSFFRRLGILLFFSIAGNPLSLALLGMINHITGCVKTVFLLYPASPRYTQAYSFDWFARKIFFTPVLLGVFRQNGKIGLTFGISATERDFLNSNNNHGLRRIHNRMESLCQTIGAQQKTFAGILPGVFVSRGILPANPPENRATVVAVLHALDKLRITTGLDIATPLVVLGAFGFVGKELLKVLEAEATAPVYPVDLHNRESFAVMMEELRGKPAIVLNLSKKGALRKYVRHLWSGVVVLNEVYPEPGKEELRLMHETGVLCWHLVGIKGTAWPPFPGAYHGGIPCCASWLPGEGDGEYEVIIERKV